MPDKESIRVILTDSQLLVRSGIACLLRSVPGIELVAEAADGEEALRLCEQLRPDVIVMELEMPNMSGVVATRLIRQRCPSTQVLILDRCAHEAFVEQVLLAGAVGYVLKDMPLEALVNSIQDANQGISSFAPEVTRVLIHMRCAPLSLEHGLTKREHEVLELLAEGLSNHEIALRYEISCSTVQFHVSNILSKLGVGNRVEAAAFAIRNNLI